MTVYKLNDVGVAHGCFLPPSTLQHSIYTHILPSTTAKTLAICALLLPAPQQGGAICALLLPAPQQGGAGSPIALQRSQ